MGWGDLIFLFSSKVAQIRHGTNKSSKSIHKRRQGPPPGQMQHLLRPLSDFFYVVLENLDFREIQLLLSVPMNLNHRECRHIFLNGQPSAPGLVGTQYTYLYTISYSNYENNFPLYHLFLPSIS